MGIGISDADDNISAKTPRWPARGIASSPMMNDLMSSSEERGAPFQSMRAIEVAAPIVIFDAEHHIIRVTIEAAINN